MLEGIAIVGLGLLGGSVGLAVRRKGLARRVYGIGRSAERLEQAVACGAIDDFALDFSPASRCELVVVCTPVGRIVRDVRAAAEAAKPGTLIVDVGSTKANLAAELSEGLPQGVEFVGCHPIAGSQRSGVESASAELFEKRVTVITPVASTTPDGLARAHAFWRSLGSRTIELDPQRHDRILATTSHAPHLVAAAMAMATPQDWLPFCGGGWRDLTRIAAGSPDNWAQIFLANRAGLLEAIADVEQRIAALRDAIETNQQAALETLLQQGKDHRDALGD